jgi:hypothetical protein
MNYQETEKSALCSKWEQRGGKERGEKAEAPGLCVEHVVIN